MFGPETVVVYQMQLGMHSWPVIRLGTLLAGVWSWSGWPWERVRGWRIGLLARRRSWSGGAGGFGDDGGMLDRPLK